jgi:hypothetical protein
MAKPKEKTGPKPVKFDEEQIEQIEKLSAVLSKEQLADYLGIHDDTFRAVEKRQPEVKAAFKRGKARAIESVASNLVNQAQQGNIAAAIFYLKTQAGWSEAKEESTENDTISRIQIEVVGANGKD